jgi:hypothetical protein
MYIRWITRRHKSRLSTDTVFHDAYLVESYRDDQGKPRQRTVAYLGNLREIDGAIPHVESELFLLRAAPILHELAAAGDADAETVLRNLRGQLPALTPEEAHHAFAAQVHWFYRWWAEHGSGAPEAAILEVVDAVLGAPRERTP